MSSGQAQWLWSGDTSLHVTLHLPTGAYRDQCIVVVPPVGHEYTHSHSSVRLLCEQLCTAGFPVARFDLEGTGNSWDGTTPQTLLAAWVRNVEDVFTWLKTQTGCQSAGIVGLRMGGSIAALYTQRHPVRSLLLWAPCIHGGAFLRDCQMIGTASQYKKDTGKLDCGGIVLDVDAQNDIAAFRLDCVAPSAERVFLLDRDDAPSGAAVRNWLAPTGIELTTTTQPRYAQMMRQSMHSLVPIDAITEMVTWFNADESTRDKTRKLTALTPAPVAPNPRNEMFCQFGVNGLFGILRRPTDRPASTLESSRTDVVIIPNAGGGHHVGPCNLHVSLARALADAGIASFRFDLRNLGDSVTGMPPTVDQPYPREAWQDLSIVLDELHVQHGFSRFAVAGLCSGAFVGFGALNRFLTGESQHPIALTVLINPSIYYWDERLVANGCMNSSRYEDVVSAYTEQLASADKFRKLLSGEVDLMRAVSTTLSRMVTKLQSMAFEVLDRAGMTKSRIAQDIEAAAARGCQVQVFAAAGDPAMAILRNLGGHAVQRLIDNGTLPVTTLRGADHTFSSAESRDRLVSALVNDIDTTLRNLA